jgi:integrase/recombinase XerD
MQAVMGKNAPELVEIAAFLEAAEEASARDHALACLLALNGLSIQAVCGATVAGLRRLADGTTTLAVSLTGGPPRSIPIAPRTAGAIQRHLDGRQEGPLLLDDDGGPLQAHAAAAIVRRIVHAAGLDYRLGRFG